MDRSVEPREFQLPLELQFSMRKAELAAQEMTWEELYSALLKSLPPATDGVVRRQNSDGRRGS
jgi:hypothetical protein